MILDITSKQNTLFNCTCINTMYCKNENFQIFNFSYEFTEIIWPDLLPQPNSILLFSTCK